MSSLEDLERRVAELEGWRRDNAEPQLALMFEVARALARGDLARAGELIDNADPNDAGWWHPTSWTGEITPPVTPHQVGERPPEAGTSDVPPAPPPATDILPQLGILQNVAGDGTLAALHLAARSRLQWVMLTSPNDLPVLFGALEGSAPKVLFRPAVPTSGGLRRASRDFGDRIVAYGLGNEPTPADGAAAAVAAKLRALAETVRAVQPKALIVGPDIQAHVLATAWGQSLIRAIAAWPAGLLSACAGHVIPVTAAEDDVLAQIATMPGALRGLGIRVPIWLTEFGHGGTADEQAAFLERAVPEIGAAGYAVAIASMLIRSHSGSYGEFGLIDSNGTAGAGWAALDALAARVRG